MKRIFTAMMISVLCCPAIFAFLPRTKAAGADPIGHWDFNEGQGSVAGDSSGNGNTGTIHGAQWVDGVNGKALRFDGINDYVYVSNSASLDISGNEISVEYWVNFPRGWYPGINITGDYTHGHIIFDKGDAYTACFYDTTGTHSFNIPYVPPYPQANKSIWNANTWYHIADVFDGSQIRIYINGVLDKTETVVGSVSQSSNNLAIGSHCYGSMGFFEGIVDDFTIYNYARTAQQIQQDAALLGQTLNLSPDTGFASTTVVGARFSNNSGVTITWDGTVIPSVPNPATTDIDGDFTALISVPTQTVPGAHMVNATDESGIWASATFTVVSMTGAKGDTGEQGSQGLQGMQGSEGPQGPPGNVQELFVFIALPTIVSVLAICLATVAVLRKRS